MIIGHWFARDRLHPCGFAGTLPKIVKLCSADFSLAHNLHLLDGRRMQRKDAFYADALDNFTDRHGSRNAFAVLSGKNHPLKDLGTLFIPFLDALVHTHGRAGFYGEKISLKLVLGYEINLIHTDASIPKGKELRKTYPL